MSNFEELLPSYLEVSDNIPEGWDIDKSSTLCNEPDGPKLVEIKEQKVVSFIKKKVVSCWNKVKDPDNFPGPQPVSLERNEIIKLSKYPYAVCEKTDGMRYFLLSCTIENLKFNFIIDRKFSIFEAPGGWTCASSYEGTLLDGEIVRDKDGKFIYFPHDCILRGGINYSSENFIKRYEHTKEISVIWRTYPTRTLFDVNCKKITNLKNLSNLLKDLSTSHAVDGLIFTPIALPIQTGTQHSLIKWKMPDKHTFDFEVERKGQRLDLYLFDKMSLIKFKTLNKRNSAGRKFFQELDRLEELSLDSLSLKDKTSGRFIVECELDNGDYIPIKMRPDKTRPNSVRTIQRTLQNIEENITVTELLDISKNLNKSLPKYVFRE